MLVCSRDGESFRRLEGIWQFLLPERKPHYARFIQDYEFIRGQEGRGAVDAEYYRALPLRDLTGRRAAEWRIRAASFHALLEKIILPMENERRTALNILDMGAGSGWLSNRLANRGHQLFAVDLTTNGFDGLGCIRHFLNTITPVQAEFDCIPIKTGAIHLVIFNAALHYSEDYERTLRQSLRVLAQDGLLVILDSPIYRSAESGEQMARERAASFLRMYGTLSNGLKSENYLTYDLLDALGESLKIRWKVITPHYGLRWRLRPLLAALLGRREPAKFHLLVGRPA